MSSDTVQISLTVVGDSSSTLWRDLDNSDLFKRLQDSSVDGAGSVTVVRWLETTVLGSTVNFVQFTDTNGFSEVDVSGGRSSTLVKPSFSVLRWKLVTTGGFDNFGVTWNFQFTLSLQKLSVGVNELLGWNVSILLVKEV